AAANAEQPCNRRGVLNAQGRKIMATNERNQSRHSNRSRISPQPTNLEERYGKIGIPAVKAAVRYACDRLTAVPSRPDARESMIGARDRLVANPVTLDESRLPDAAFQNLLAGRRQHPNPTAAPIRCILMHPGKES